MEFLCSIGFITLFCFIYLGSTAFYYALIFTVIVVVGVVYLSLSGFISGAFSLAMVTIYVGAIIVIVGYISAVVPNPILVLTLELKYLTAGAFILNFFFSLITLDVSVFYKLRTGLPPSNILGEYYYRVVGGYIFYLLIILLLFILVLVSTSIMIKSTLRRV